MKVFFSSLTIVCTSVGENLFIGMTLVYLNDMPKSISLLSICTHEYKCFIKFFEKYSFILLEALS